MMETLNGNTDPFHCIPFTSTADTERQKIELGGALFTDKMNKIVLNFYF